MHSLRWESSFFSIRWLYCLKKYLSLCLHLDVIRSGVAVNQLSANRWSDWDTEKLSPHIYLLLWCVASDVFSLTLRFVVYFTCKSHWQMSVSKSSLQGALAQRHAGRLQHMVGYRQNCQAQLQCIKILMCSIKCVYSTIYKLYTIRFICSIANLPHN